MKKNNVKKTEREFMDLNRDFFDDDEFCSDEELEEIIRDIPRRKRRLQQLRRKALAEAESLKGRCLVYIGNSDNELYKGAVIYITKSEADEVCGIMINKLLFGSASVECKGKNDKEVVSRNIYEDLYQGGPVNPQHGFVLFPTDDYEFSDPDAKVFGDISVSTSFGVLQGILDGIGPEKKIIAMGHCVWHHGELEWELFNNQWMIVPASLGLLFETKFEDKWETALKASGMEMGRYITNQIGFA